MLTHHTDNKVAIFDYDGTLVLMPKKKWFGGEFNWDIFINWMHGNPTIDIVNDAMEKHRSNGEMVAIVTARPESTYGQFKKELETRGINPDFIIMRPDNQCTEETRQLSKLGSENTGTVADGKAKDICLRNHALYREQCVDYIHNHLGLTIVAAYDDQLPNLSVYRDVGADCYLISDGLMKSLNLKTGI